MLIITQSLHCETVRVFVWDSPVRPVVIFVSATHLTQPYPLHNWSRQKKAHLPRQPDSGLSVDVTGMKLPSGRRFRNQIKPAVVSELSGNSCVPSVACLPLVKVTIGFTAETVVRRLGVEFIFGAFNVRLAAVLVVCISDRPPHPHPTPQTHRPHPILSAPPPLLLEGGALWNY